MWRDLTDEERHRPPERDVRITDVRTAGIEGNPRDDGGYYTWGIVKVETDAGVHGIGEAYRGTEAMALAGRIAPEVIGENPLDPRRIRELLAGEYTGSGTVGQSAITAIETACWDVKGKVHDLPVYELLGGKFRDRIELYSDTDALARGKGEEDPGEAYTPEAVAAAAREAVDRGFGSIKFDLDVPAPGHDNPDTAARRLTPGEIDHKVEMVRAAREAVGDEVDLGMDLHWKFSVETAIRLGRALEEFDLAFLEDPVHPEKLDAQRRVRQAVDIPILTGENVTTANRFLDLLGNDTLDIAAPDTARCGGLSEFVRIAALCDAHGVVMAPHNLASPVGTIAAVHACASVPNVYSLEYRGGDAPWWDDVVTLTGCDGPILADGHVEVPNGPGLGIGIDPDGIGDRFLEGGAEVFR